MQLLSHRVANSSFSGLCRVAQKANESIQRKETKHAQGVCHNQPGPSSAASVGLGVVAVIPRTAQQASYLTSKPSLRSCCREAVASKGKIMQALPEETASTAPGVQQCM